MSESYWTREKETGKKKKQKKRKKQKKNMTIKMHRSYLNKIYK